MKSKLKRGIIITVLTLVGICLIYGVYIAFFTGIKNNSEYKYTLDKAFGGKYTIKQTDRKLDYYHLPVIGIPLPNLSRKYEITYTDSNGKERIIEDWYYPFPSDLQKDYFPKECETVKGFREFQHDLFLNELQMQEQSILSEDLSIDLLYKNFDGELEYNGFSGDDYLITMYFNTKNCKPLYEYNPDLTLCNEDINAFIESENSELRLVMYLDRGHSDKADEYIEKMKSVLEEYSSISKNNCHYLSGVVLADDISLERGDTIYEQEYKNGKIDREYVDDVYVHQTTNDK